MVLCLALLVPSPAWVPVIGYHHVGQLVYLGEDLLALEGSPQIPRWFIGSAADHAKDGYYAKLSALLQDSAYGALDGCAQSTAGAPWF